MMKTLKNCKVSFEEWKNRVEKNDSFKLLDIFYVKRKDNNRNETWLKILHIPCGYEFDRPSSMYSKTKSSNYCPNCGNELSVSKFHAVIATYGLNKNIGCEIEYCIGFKGEKGKESPYDLFIPSNVSKGKLVEFQSRYHDNREEFDTKKKIYAIENGYEYYSFDHRKDDIHNAIYILFGDKDVSLSDIQFDNFKRIKIDLIKAQQMLNDYVPFPKILKELNVSENSLRGIIKDNILKLPHRYKEITNNEFEVIQLTMDGEYIAEHKNATQASNVIGKHVDLSGEKQLWYRCGYVFVRKEDYENNNYYIEDYVQNHCKTFYEIDDNGVILKTYTSLTDAKNDIGVTSVTFITRVLTHKQEKTRGHKFVWKYEYEKQTQ